MQQLSQWREEKEAEAMKNAVLDTEAAARFSTAAALASKESGTQETVDWRDNTLATKSPPRDQQPRGVNLSACNRLLLICFALSD